MRHNRALHEHVLAVTSLTEPVPWIDDDRRVAVRSEAPNFWRATVRYGFMERPDIPRLLQQLPRLGCNIDLADVTYYVGHETVVHREDGEGLPLWQEAVFTVMERNAVHVTDYFRLPTEQVVEIGRQIAI
jgi:KUP system potassium uptake protein